MNTGSMFDGTKFFWTALSLVFFAPVAYWKLDEVLSSQVPVLDSPKLSAAIIWSSLSAFHAANLIQIIGLRRVTGIADPYTTISLKNGLGIPIVHAALCIGMIVAGLVDFHQTGQRAIALYMAPLLLIGGSFGLLIRTITPRPALTLSADGLEYSTFRIGPISWDDIEQVDAKEVLGRKYAVVIRLRNTEKYIQRSAHSWIGRLIFVRQLKNSTVSIPTQVFGADADELAEAIKLRREVLSF